jgi:3-oxoadipate enol-lactonase
LIKELLDRRLKPLEQGKTISDLMPQMIEVLTGPHSPATTVDRLTAALLAVRVETYKQALRAISVVNFRSILPTIAVPTLVVVGSDDRLTPPSMSDELASAIPGAERVLIGEAGHVSNLDQPAMFNEVVGDFLNRHSRLASKVTTA